VMVKVMMTMTMMILMIIIMMPKFKRMHRYQSSWLC
jgi:hypothetical protein